MHFNDEEEVNAWYAAEKEKLDARFMAAIDKDKENIPKDRERYEISLKKLIERYQLELQLLVDRDAKRRK